MRGLRSHSYHGERAIERCRHRRGGIKKGKSIAFLRNESVTKKHNRIVEQMEVLWKEPDEHAGKQERKGRGLL